MSIARWRDLLPAALDRMFTQLGAPRNGDVQRCLVNCASVEYFAALRGSGGGLIDVVVPVFKDGGRSVTVYTTK